MENAMKSLFTWALVCFSLSVMMAVISLVLGTGLNYHSYVILFNGLAPVLRRHGYYMVHGFAASKGGRALLLVG